MVSRGSKTQGGLHARLAAMTICGWLISAVWLVLVVYWVLTGRRVKRGTGSRWTWWREIAVRLGFFALVLLALEIALVGRASTNMRPYTFNTSLLMGCIGFVFCALGVGLVISARIHLGRTWCVSVSRNEGPELVTTGPYAFVRHPVYSGMLLAMIGSAIGQSLFWLFPLVVYGPNFILSARREERLLIEHFPERYRAYKMRTKMMLPFVI
jgi:protein-S-isoprenylcysteine O-methyltransferase Ste14